MLRLIVPIEKILPIPKTKFVDPAIVLSSFIKRIFCKAFNWPRPSVDQVAALESINSLLNLKLLYYILVDIMKL